MSVKNKNSKFDYLNIIFLLVLCALFLYPLILTFSLSISSSIELGYKKMSLMPVGFSLESYTVLLSDVSVIRYYLNTILYAGLGVFFTLLFTSMFAYPLMFKDLRGRKFITILLVVSMFFSGGLIPTYLVIQRLKLLNSIWALILPGVITAYTVVIFRTFFSQLPSSLRESATIDGAGEFTVLFKIIMPLSKPLLATFALFTVVGHWNSYLPALMYLHDQSKYPIQMFLRRILVLLDYTDMNNIELIELLENVNERTVKAAAVIITIVPIFSFYPFMQKYFTKGIMVGSIKG